MLDTNKVPTGSRCGVWSPAACAKFKQIPALVNAEKCGTTSALRSGSVGEVFGISNYMTQAVREHKAGDLSATSGSITVSADVNGGSEVTFGGTGLAGSLRKGDLVKVGVKTYTVKEDATASGGSITVKLYPEVKASKSEVVTLVGDHTANLVFHPSAFGFVTRPLSTPAGVESYVTTYNGISLRVVRGYDMKYKREMLSMDVLYAFRTIYPELAVRYLT